MDPTIAELRSMGPPEPHQNERVLQGLTPPQPLRDIEKPTNHDVLCGRGVTTNRFPGNENFRSLVGCNKELYVTSTKKQKMRISRSIVLAVRTLDPPGRFLEKEPDSGLYYDIGEKKAIEKTSQALRDGAAKLRKQLSQDLNDPDFLDAVFDASGKPLPSAPSDPKKKKSAGNKKAAKKAAESKKAKPPAKKGHRRTKSNPTVGSAGLKAKALASENESMPPTPRMKHSYHSSYPRQPLSPRAYPPSPPRSSGSPRPSHLALPGAQNPHQRSQSMPAEPFPAPGSPSYHYHHHADPNYHPLYASPTRSKSFDQGPEYYERPPPPRFGPPGSPALYPGRPSASSRPPPMSPPLRPPPPRSPYGMRNGGYVQQVSPRWSPHAVSPRWSPHAAFNARTGPRSMSPYPYLHPSDFHRSPGSRPPPGLSPRAPFPRNGRPSSPGGSLCVPSLSFEGPPMGPPSGPPMCPPMCPPLGPPMGPPRPFQQRSCLPMAPARYPPPSPRACLSGSPYRRGSPLPVEFSPPNCSPQRQRPFGQSASPVFRDRSWPIKMEIDDSEHEESGHCMKITFDKNQGGEEAADKSETPPAIEVELMDKKMQDASPSAVAEVLSMSENLNKSLLMPRKLENDYPSDEEPNPAADYCMSPLPFDPDESPDTLMEVPGNILSLPISPCGGSSDSES